MVMQAESLYLHALQEIEKENLKMGTTHAHSNEEEGTDID
jgi:hypothetical protein